MYIFAAINVQHQVKDSRMKMEVLISINLQNVKKMKHGHYQQNHSHLSQMNVIVSCLREIIDKK